MKKHVKIRRVERDEVSQYLVMLIDDKDIVVLINGEEEDISIPPKVRTCKVNGDNVLYFRDRQAYPVRYDNFKERIHPMSIFVKSFDISEERLKAYEIISKKKWSVYRVKNLIECWMREKLTFLRIG